MIGFDGNVNRRKEEGKEGKGLQKETDVLDRTIELRGWGGQAIVGNVGRDQQDDVAGLDWVGLS